MVISTVDGENLRAEEEMLSDVKMDQNALFRVSRDDDGVILDGIGRFGEVHVGRPCEGNHGLVVCLDIHGLVGVQSLARRLFLILVYQSPDIENVSLQALREEGKGYGQDGRRRETKTLTLIAISWQTLPQLLSLGNRYSHSSRF